MRDLWICFWAYVRIYCPKLLWVLTFTIIFMVLYTIIQKKTDANKGNMNKSILYKGLFSLECSFILVMTLFGRVRGDYGNIAKPFESYLNAFMKDDIEQKLQILMNIVMYVPLGVLLPCCFKKIRKVIYVLAVSMICSASIEIIQGIFKIGLFEADDIINNTLGATVGVILYKILVRAKEKWNRMRE